MAKQGQTHRPLTGKGRKNEMFREIRKKKNEINIAMAKLLLESSRRGVLAVNGDDGYPYAIGRFSVALLILIS